MLAGGVVHELNNALTPILNYAKLALRNPDPAYRERGAQADHRGRAAGNHHLAGDAGLVAARRRPGRARAG